VQQGLSSRIIIIIFMQQDKGLKPWQVLVVMIAITIVLSAILAVLVVGMK
jgi:FlaG/FlaF family flagellin (archaellin)